MNDKIKNSSSLREGAPIILSLKEELENNIKNLVELAQDKIGYSSSLMKAFMSSIEKLQTMPYGVQLKAMDLFKSVVVSTGNFSDVSLLAAAKATKDDTI